MKKGFLLFFLLINFRLLALEPQFRMDPGEMRLAYLEMEVEELRKDGNFILYEPHRQIMSATYETFYIPLNNFEGYFGEWDLLEEQEITVGGYLVRLSYENYSPDNRFLPQPQGGFSTIPYLFFITVAE